MKILNYTQVSFSGSKTDLSFINRIRDKNVQKFETLQKSKVELLIKLRQANKVLEEYRLILPELIQQGFNKEIISAKKDLSEMEDYVNILRSKLHEINLEILSEEEKNY